MPDPLAAFGTMPVTLQEKTGRSLEDWQGIVRGLGLTKHGEILKALKQEHGLSHGYANMLALLATGYGTAPQDDLLAGLFAALALVLAAIGIYGMIAYQAAARRHELGVRMALGAQRGEIFRRVVGEGVKLGALGVGLGLVIAVFVSRLLRSLLFGVSATDPLTFVSVPLLLLAIALLASLLPARQVTALDPASTLRQD